MWLIHFGGWSLGKMWKNMGKRPFFRAATAGLVKYCTGVNGRIGVYIMSISPVNICWLRHSTGARPDKTFVFCYHISTHSFHIPVFSISIIAIKYLLYSIYNFILSNTSLGKSTVISNEMQMMDIYHWKAFQPFHNSVKVIRYLHDYPFLFFHIIYFSRWGSFKALW